MARPLMKARYRLGVDVGGTFTDLTIMDEASGRLKVFKVPSTPARPQRAVIDGVTGVMNEFGIAADEIAYFVHGTTIAVNTVIERSGARTGLLVTEGFRDLMTLGRSRLADIYSFLVDRPEPLVPRRLVRTIDERILANGQIYHKLDEAQVERAAGELAAAGVEALAVCFLHAYRNPAHEQRAREIARTVAPGLYVTISSEVWPQMREYERALVTLINAHVGPRMDAYFETLLAETGKVGVSANVFSTKSNGGVMTARSARRVPVQTLVSGPASGVIGAQYIGRLAGMDRLIGFDMGGTSTDVAVIDREILYSTENTVGDFQVVMPAVDVSSIGAGGGSIAWVDPSGVLKVGPKSAGASPGPACYGLGGEQPTITDAYVVLGIIDPDRFLGGRMRLSAGRAEQAVDGIAKVLELGRAEAAEAILQVATSNMYSTLVPLMAQKGVDISEFALLTYGGAGPTHGFLLAREVGILRIIVPPHPGALCALGCLVADVKSDFIRTVNVEIDEAHAGEIFGRLHEAYADIEREARAWLSEERVEVKESRVVLSADMRYAGQAFEIDVLLPGRDPSPKVFGEAMLAAFRDRYRALYGVGDLAASEEVVNIRASVVGVTGKPAVSKVADAEVRGDAVPRGTRDVHIDGKVWKTAVYVRDDLRWGQRCQGPAVIYQYDSTVFIPPGISVRVDAYGNLLGELES